MRRDEFGTPAGTLENFLLSRLRQDAVFGSNPGALRMFSYRPPALPARAPLVVLLHGCGQTAKSYDQGAGWSTMADRLGFALLAPEQTKANNFNGCFNWYIPADVARNGGEVESILQMVAAAVSSYSCDPKRIYVTGLSAGGAMTSALLAAAPDVFAGGAIIAGLAYGAAGNMQEAFAAMQNAPRETPGFWGDAVRRASPHKGPWPRISVWHGDADRTVSISNMEAIIAQWRDVHQLAEATQRDAKDGVLHLTWHGEKQEALIEAYTISGMGHGTPIKPGRGKNCCGQAAPFILDVGLSSTAQISQFFELRTPAESKKPTSETIPETIQKEEFLQPDSSSLPSTGRLRRIITNALRATGLIKQ